MKIKTEIIPKITFEYDQLQFTQNKDIYVMTSLKAPTSEEDKKRADIDLVCVIDKSGSMEGEKLKLVKASLNFMVEQLKPQDKLSIITFDTHVSVDLSLCKMDTKGKENAIQIIKEITPGTATNLSGGLFEAFDVLQSCKEASEVSSILLFTDGLANQGVTKTSDIVPSIQKLSEGFKYPCPVYTFGFGSDHDPEMLKSISEASTGLYYFVAKEDEIPTCFADCLGGLLSIVAQNIKISIQTTEKIEILSSLSSYKAKFNKNKTFCELNIGDIYSEETRDLVFILKIPGVLFENLFYNVLEMELSYYNVIERSLKKMKIDGYIKRPCNIQYGTNLPNVSLDQQRNRIETTKALEISRAKADQGALDEARATLKNMIQKIQFSVSKDTDFSKQLIQDLENLLVKLENKKIYQSEGSKWMHNFEESQRRQRATKPEYFASTGGYTNNFKLNMKCKFK
jgi:hypothetical protein